MKQRILLFGAIIVLLITGTMQANGQKRMRDFGINTGVFKTGKNNAITDVPGVTVGHVTCFVGDDIRTGVTAIIPHQGNIYQNKVPAGIYAGNGFGKLAGSTQVQEDRYPMCPKPCKSSFSFFPPETCVFHRFSTIKANHRTKCSVTCVFQWL